MKVGGIVNVDNFSTTRGGFRVPGARGPGSPVGGPPSSPRRERPRRPSGSPPPARPGARGGGARLPRPEEPPAPPPAGPPGLPPPPGPRRRAPPHASRPPDPGPRRPALTHLSFSVPKMEAKYSAISHPPPRPPTLLRAPTTPPDACGRRHPDATTLAPRRRPGGAAQSEETLPARGRGLARAGGTTLAAQEPARPPPAPPPGAPSRRSPASLPCSSRHGRGLATPAGVPWCPEKPSAQTAVKEEEAADEELLHPVTGAGPGARLSSQRDRCPLPALSMWHPHRLSNSSSGKIPPPVPS